MKTSNRTRIALRLACVPLAAAMLLALAACNGHGGSSSSQSAASAPPPPPPPPPAPPVPTSQATYNIAVTFDPQTKQVAVSPMSIDVASGVTATATWTSATPGYQVATVKECEGGGFSGLASATGTFTVTDDNTSSSSSGDWYYQVTLVDDKGNTASSAPCSAPDSDKPVLHNHKPVLHNH